MLDVTRLSDKELGRLCAVGSVNWGILDESFFRVELNRGIKSNGKKGRMNIFRKTPGARG
jgi:hypothetical protein